MIKAFIPNILTALNLICGCFSIAFAFQFQFEVVLILVLLGVFFDYLDGIVARILNAESEFGKHLDSLSDIVTSGVVPGIIVYQLFKLSGNRVTDFNLDLNLEPIINLDLIFSISPIAFTAFIITLGSALRLAKFNTIDYTSKSINQFFGCTGIAVGIHTADSVRSDEYIFGYECFLKKTCSVACKTRVAASPRMTDCVVTSTSKKFICLFYFTNS